jgi:hypothetical protein
MSRALTTHERQAVARVERAIGRLPESIAIYFHGDDATIMECDEDGRIRRLHDGQGDYDREAILETMRTPRCAAGAW